MRVSDVGPDPSDPRERKLTIQHLHAGVVGADHPGPEQFLLHRLIERIEQARALRHPSAHGLARNLHPVPLPNLFLPVQGLVIGPLGHNHLRQQTRSRCALLDGLRRLGGGLHRAFAGVLEANVLNHLHRGGNVFIAFAGLFGDQPQVLAAAGTVLIRLGQVVNDSLPCQMPRQGLAAAPFPIGRFVRFLPGSRRVVEIVVVLAGSRCLFRTPRLPGRLEQRQLLFRQPLTFAVPLRLQQFAQQTLIFVLLGQGTIQLCGQIHHDLLQCLCIPRQTFWIDGHCAFSLNGNQSVSK